MLGKRASKAVRLVVQLVLEGWKGRLEGKAGMPSTENGKARGSCAESARLAISVSSSKTHVGRVGAADLRYRAGLHKSRYCQRDISTRQGIVAVVLFVGRA